jgi:cell wall-associated NlpC family hydrolase
VAGPLRTRFVARVGKDIGEASRRGVARKVAIAGASAALVAGLVTYGSLDAGAAPQPTIAQVQAKVNSLSAQYDRAVQQYDQENEQLTAAKAQLARVNKEYAADEAQFKAAHQQMAQIAAADYEDSGSTSLAGLLTANNPATVLSEANLMLQVAGSRNQQAQAYLAAAQQVASVQQQKQRTESGIAALTAQKAQTKNSFEKSLNAEKAILDSLTASQRQKVVTAGGGSTSATNTVSTSTQAGKAVAFMFQELNAGCPYVFGGTGPCPAGYDCSGLVQAAWASAGVTIPRDTYSQWASLPAVSSTNLQIGDLLFYNGIGHVAMYVGNGHIIDALNPSAGIRYSSITDSWYAANYDGAIRV